MLYLSELIGLPVYDSSGKKIGKVSEMAAMPAVPRPRVVFFLVRSGRDQQNRTVSLAVALKDVSALSPSAIRLSVPAVNLSPFQPDEGLLLLRKDLLDQQIIDVNGRKVVRVNDLALEDRSIDHHMELWLSSVDIGLTGALRRLFIGAVPRYWLRKLESQIRPTSIPWEFVNILEPDPLRQLKLNISHKVLANLHPADLADIMEELAPKERHAVFTALDDETVAEVLSEIEPKLRHAILDSMGIARAADVVEEMEPDAAADLLGDLPEEAATELLQDMNREEAAELGELLEFPENCAGGLMNTAYVAIPASANVDSARQLISSMPELPENFTTIFLVDAGGKLAGSVPVGKLIVASGKTSMLDLRSDPVLWVRSDSPEKDVVELFDKYNLLSLPVIEEDHQLAGSITVDDIITLLCRKS